MRKAIKAQAISVRFPQDLYDELRDQAEASGVPIALLVRAHVKLSIERGRDVSELLEDAVLPIGQGRLKESSVRRAAAGGIPPTGDDAEIT